MTDAEIQLALTLIFCFGLLALGLKEPVFMMFAGMVWIIGGLAVFWSYGIWMGLISIAIGAICLWDGGSKI